MHPLLPNGYFCQASILRKHPLLPSSSHCPQEELSQPVKHFCPSYPDSPPSLETASRLYAAFVFQKRERTGTCRAVCLTGTDMHTSAVCNSRAPHSPATCLAVLIQGWCLHRVAYGENTSYSDSVLNI